MPSDSRQLVVGPRAKIALAVVVASTLLAATATPLPRAAGTVSPTASQAVAVEAVMTSVAPLSQLNATTGSASPPDLPAPRATNTGAAVSSDESFAEDEAPAPHHEGATPAQRLQLSAESLCLTPNSSPQCEATFNAALRSSLQPADVVVTASGSAEIVGPRGAEPLRFQKHAPWVRRLETLGKEGIPFARFQHGPDQEVVVGINRKGVLGVSLRERRD